MTTNDYMNPELRDWLLAASFGEGWSRESDAAGESRDVPGEIFEAPVLPLRETSVFPRAISSLEIDRPRSLFALEAASENGSLILCIPQKNALVEEPRPTEMTEFGTAARLGRWLRLPDGGVSALARGLARVQVLEWTQATPFLVARVRALPEVIKHSPSTQALMRAVMSLYDQIVELDETLSEDAYVYAMNIDDPGWLADFIAQNAGLSFDERAGLVALPDPSARLQKLSALLAKRLDVLKLQSQIENRVQVELDKNGREAYLREQLKQINTELGELDPDARENGPLRERMRAKKMPDAVKAKLDEEMARLARTPSMSPEQTITRGYIEWILDLPWAERTEDNLDVARAEKILNQRHYGLKKAKERILEHIAVRKLNTGRSDFRSPIICFVGPPGTGKTSLANSIAESLGRKFVRVSLGGVRDEAEIRGHRRTYVGAMPGRILQTMKRAGVINPLFVLDEIDKLASDYRGDPAAAMLEVLDPEQNHNFEDHYLDFPYDLSQVMWITTANSLYSIPSALEDRMEVIEFPGYVEEEKIHIARQFLVPRQMEQNGLSGKPLAFGDDALKRIIREYTYEAGVRELDRKIAQVCRKIARRRAENAPTPARIVSGSLDKFLGPPHSDITRIEKEDQIGVVNGVSWTQAGGDLLPIEVILMEGNGNLTLTGQLGDVMQESAKTAFSYVRMMAQKEGAFKASYFEKTNIHIHAPEGAVPKDGPSAGIALATAIVSALSKTPVRRDVAMTGETTLRGRVLPIGSLREKLLAAHRAGIKTFIMPEKNRKDLAEVPRNVLRDVKVICVSEMEEVLKHALSEPLPLAPPEKTSPKPRKPPAKKKPVKKPVRKPVVNKK